MIKRDESGKFVSTPKEEQTKASYSYYSRVLNRPFDTLDELKEAETSFRKNEEEKIIKDKIRKTRAMEVEAAGKAVLVAKKEAREIITKAQEEAAKKIKDAETKYAELRDSFAKDYNGYHSTYVNNNGEESITFGDVLDTFNNIFKLF